jgi:hypothetical protein
MPEACIVCDGKASDLQELHDILNSASPVAFRVTA